MKGLKSKGRVWGILLATVVLISIFTLSFIIFGLYNPSKANLEKIRTDGNPKTSDHPFEEVAVNANPRIPNYSVEPDLKDVVNIKDFEFSDVEKKLLAKNLFVVARPSYNDEFFQLYEENGYNYIPNFITTDSILHNYHLMFEFLLKKIEKEKLLPELKDLSTNMLYESLNQYNYLKGTEWESAAKRNVQFFAVGCKLLDLSISIPSIAVSEVKKELSLIESHEGIENSPTMGTNEDYSQYIPRGHYYKTKELKSYFRAMMWFGRFSFILENNEGIKSSVLITLALNKERNRKSWEKIYETINFFVGEDYDINYYQFEELLEKVYGNDTTIQSIINNKSKFSYLVSEVKKLKTQQAKYTFNTKDQRNSEKETKVFKFMGQRFTIDTFIFEKLVDPEVPRRAFPRGLDIPAALGSKEALNILKEMGETNYQNYLENMSELQKYLGELPVAVWVQNLYWSWLYMLIPLLWEKSNGYPSFMQNTDWSRKDINTFLGSWTELKHDTILYSRQVYAEMGGEDIVEKDDRGYVEPNPYVYARLVSLLEMTKEKMKTYDLLTEGMKSNLDKMEELTMKLKIISEKELNNEELTESEYEIIRSYGGQLEHFWLEVNKDEPEFKEGYPDIMNYLNENPAAIVADVATSIESGLVLEEGIGKILEIYVIVPVKGKLKITKGGIFSYYEFTWPMLDRLTDKRWRELLYSSDAPKLPSWTTFIAK